MIRKAGRLLLASVVAVGVLATNFISSPKPAMAKPPAFKDIKGHWAESAIMQASSTGIIDGFPDGTFRPDDVVKGDQFVTMMLKAFSKTDSNGGLQFDPVWMDQLNDNYPARYGAIKSTIGRTGFDFRSAQSGYWAAPTIDFLYSMEFLLENNEVFPKNYSTFQKEITREKASYLLGEWFTDFEDNFDGLYEDYVLGHTGLRDMGDFSQSLASLHRGTVLMAGLMRGWDNKFWPQRYVTRAEALTMVFRLKDAKLRDPYKPDMSGQLYTDVNGKIYIFSDKTKYNTYNKIVELANDTVTTGYVDRSGKGIGVWDSKESRDKADFLVRRARGDEAPMSELSISVASGNSEYIILDYLTTKELNHSARLFDAGMELLAGAGYGQELKAKVESLEGSLAGDATRFSLNGKAFAIYTTGKRIILSVKY